MSFFNNTIAAYLNKSTVFVAFLVKFDFVDEVKRVWNGVGPLRAGGFVWEGLGGLGGIAGLEQSMGTNAPQTQFTLSGVDPTILSLLIGDEENYVGRMVVVYLQFLNQKYQPIDEPVVLRSLLMDAVTVTRGGTSETGSAVRHVSMPAETLFYGRGISPYGQYSDTDQKRRYPEDRFFEFVSDLQRKVIAWPTF